MCIFVYLLRILTAPDYLSACHSEVRNTEPGDSRNEGDLQNCICLRSIKLKYGGRKYEKIFLF